jgi:hypothetical protein
MEGAFKMQKLNAPSQVIIMSINMSFKVNKFILNKIILSK